MQPLHPSKYASLFSKKQKYLKEDFFGTSPTPFVGKWGYPNINVGIMAIPEIEQEAWKYDAPRFWARSNLGIPEIVDYRTSLINSMFQANIKQSNISQKLLELSQEIGMSSRPVEIEINLENKPFFRMNTYDNMAPTGPNAKLRKAKITENPKIEKKVDKAVSDTDLKAVDAVLDLFNSGYDENFLTKLLSIGNLGIKENRKLVPTRWSITAVDDAIGKDIINQILDFNELGFCAFSGDYLGNHYLILTFPETWRYELFEMYAPSMNNPSPKIWTDYESSFGRKTYASDTAGGYYAARLPILEKLKSLKKRASILALRFITEEYSSPLGVWVVRETVRKTMEANPIVFQEERFMMRYAESYIKKKFGFDITNIFKKSLLLKEIRDQPSLKTWFD
ncbi:MAG: hypothetical protein V1740_01615 [Candidatus Woesearchaeota archaeon]